MKTIDQVFQQLKQYKQEHVGGQLGPEWTKVAEELEGSKQFRDDGPLGNTKHEAGRG